MWCTINFGIVHIKLAKFWNKSGPNTNTIPNRNPDPNPNPCQILLCILQTAQTHKLHAKLITSEKVKSSADSTIDNFRYTAHGILTINRKRSVQNVHDYYDGHDDM